MLKAKADLLDWITGCWPQLERKLPDVLYFIKERNREIVTSWNSRTILDWMYVLGYKDFLKAEGIPGTFFACGIDNHAVSEYLFVVWKEADRYFIFYDRYALHIAESDDSIIHTSLKLNQAMDEWETGKQFVVNTMG